MATHLATELRELQTLSGLELQHPASPRCVFWYSQIARSVLSRKRWWPPRQMIAGLHAAPLTRTGSLTAITLVRDVAGQRLG